MVPGLTHDDMIDIPIPFGMRCVVEAVISLVPTLELGDDELLMIYSATKISNL